MLLLALLPGHAFHKILGSTTKGIVPFSPPKDRFLERDMAYALRLCLPASFPNLLLFILCCPGSPCQCYLQTAGGKGPLIVSDFQFYSLIVHLQPAMLLRSNNSVMA